MIKHMKILLKLLKNNPSKVTLSLIIIWVLSLLAFKGYDGSFYLSTILFALILVIYRFWCKNASK